MEGRASAAGQHCSTIGIVGAGRVGLQFYRLFTQGTDVKVAYVADREITAPACKAASTDGIPVFTDFVEAITRISTDFILEITGSNDILAKIKQKLDGRATNLITHDMAFIMMKSIEDDTKRTKKAVSLDIENIRKDIGKSFDMMGSTVAEIKKTMNDLRLLSLNARIEAAHAGEAGRGFDIVAQSVEKTSEEVRAMAENIEEVNAGILKVMNRIGEALERLK
jgi:glyceraldehyde-3-phosphate dehydrogenase/erythrose-4-phosphate dehydrogenase